MKERIIKTKHKQAYDTEENWKTNNPILLAGQLAYSSDKYGKYKIGDGISHWNELDYCDNNSIPFISDDNLEPTNYSNVELLESGEKHSSILNKLSTMFKNIRYLYKILGTTDISSIGNGTITDAISRINADLADNRKFLLPYAVEGTQTDTTAVDLSNPWGHNNRVCYVEKGISGSLPSDCQRGVRETFFCKDNSAVIKITGFDSDGNPAVWTARFNGTTWSPGWAKFVSSTGNAVVSHKISEITHSSKISINTGCSDTVGCILDSAVMLTVYFAVTEQINQGESIFTLPPIYWPNKIIAISFTENGPSGRYYGGISSRGAVYPDMDIPQGVIIRLAVSYFKS